MLEEIKCQWCDCDYFLEDMQESRFLGGLVCPICRKDEPHKTLGEIQKKLKDRAIKSGEGWVK